MRATILMASSYLADDWLLLVTLYDLGYKPREHYAPFLPFRFIKSNLNIRF